VGAMKRAAPVDFPSRLQSRSYGLALSYRGVDDFVGAPCGRDKEGGAGGFSIATTKPLLRVELLW
jgi:hypothetical protein